MGKSLQKAVEAIYDSLSNANKYFYESIYYGDDEGYSIGLSEYYLERAFIELLMVLEHAGFEKTYEEVSQMFKKAKNEKGGITKSDMGPDEPYLVWPGEIRYYVDSLADIYDIKQDHISDTKRFNRSYKAYCLLYKQQICFQKSSTK